MKSLFDGLKKMTKGSGPPTPPLRTFHATITSENAHRSNGVSPSGDASDAASSGETRAGTKNSAELTLELGDFLPRIPSELLRPGKHDPRLPVVVPVSQVARCLAGGRSGGLLSEVFKAGPDIFEEGVLAGPPIEVLYPWRKILTLVKEFLRDDEVGAGLLAALEASKKQFFPISSTASFSQADPEIRSSREGTSATRPLSRNGKPMGAPVSWFSPVPTAPLARPSHGAGVPGTSKDLTPKPPLKPSGVNLVTAVDAVPDLLLTDSPMVQIPEPTSEAAEEASLSVAADINHAPAPPSILPDLALPSAPDAHGSMPELSVIIDPSGPASSGSPASVHRTSPGLAVLPPASADAPIPALSPVEIPLLSILPPPEAAPAATARFPELAIVSEHADSPAKPDLALVEESAPALTVLAGPASLHAIPGLADGVHHTLPSAAPLHSLAKADRPDLAPSLEPVTPASLLDLSVVSAPMPAPSATALAFAPDVTDAADVVRELARLQDERDSVVAQLDEHSAVSARERAELQREHEDIVATLMAEHEATLAKVRAEHAAAVTESARKHNEAVSEAQQAIAALKEQAAVATAEADKTSAVAEELAARDAALATAAQRTAEMQARLDWQDRSLATFESEVETYRQRITTVLQQRDELTRERDALREQFRTPSQLDAGKDQLRRRLEAKDHALAVVKDRFAQLSAITGEIILQVHALSADEGAVTRRPSSDHPVSPNPTVPEAKP